MLCHTSHALARLLLLWIALVACVLGSPAFAQIGGTRDISAVTLQSPTNLTGMIGQPIVEVRLVQRGRWKSSHQIKSVTVGQPLTGFLARRAATELLDTGVFADVQVYAYRKDNGVGLRIEALPRRLIASRMLFGSPLDASEVWHDSGITQSNELTEPGLKLLAESIRRLHHRRGYHNATVYIETRDTNDPRRVLLFVHVDAGQAVRIREVIIRLPHGASEQLRNAVQDYEVAKHAPADETAIRAADQALEDTLRRLRYPSAEVTHEVQKHIDGVTLFVNVTPGPYLVFRFEGNQRFDRDQLTSAIGYEREPDRSPSALADKLQTFYRQMGFLDASVHAQPLQDASNKTDAVVFRIRERRPVVVASIDFPCLAGGAHSPDDLREKVGDLIAEQLPSQGLLRAVPDSIADQLAGPTGTTGARITPYFAQPRRTYEPVVYEKVAASLQDMYRSEGYLSATVGPVQATRRWCDAQSAAGTCVARALPSSVRHACLFDARGLPLEDPPADASLQCKPDTEESVDCESQVRVYIPIKLGPRATLYDIVFEGNRVITQDSLAELADLSVGAAASKLELEQARKRVAAAYRDLGYAYATVKTTLDLSTDKTRARARFVIAESQQVIVDKIRIVGAERTSESLVRNRVALRVGEPYSTSAVRKTEERIATLGTFSSVSVSLENPYSPAQRKTVIIQVQERVSQYLEIRPGFSTGEGVRGHFEYGHLNIGGQGIRFTLRLRLSYLHDPFILDSTVKKNLGPLPVSQRLERHSTATVLLPEVGLGPLISLSVDGIDVRSNARDFGLTKNALATTLHYRPTRSLSFSIGSSLERNDVGVFGGKSLGEYLQRPGISADVRRLLLVPDGLTYAIAQLATVQWDRRDSPLGATSGTLLSASIEHVSAYPGDNNQSTVASDFLRLSTTTAGYLRLSESGLTLAMMLKAGRIVQLREDSETYPDRRFFLGGVDSLRSMLRDSLISQDAADYLAAAFPQLRNQPELYEAVPRGGDVFINPRAELRIPVTEVTHTVVFAEAGNVWVRAEALNPTRLRYAAGSGVRFITPVGPIALDYGINMNRRWWEDFGALHFSIGLF